MYIGRTCITHRRSDRKWLVFYTSGAFIAKGCYPADNKKEPAKDMEEGLIRNNKQRAWENTQRWMWRPLSSLRTTISLSIVGWLKSNLLNAAVFPLRGWVSRHLSRESVCASAPMEIFAEPQGRRFLCARSRSVGSFERRCE